MNMQRINFNYNEIILRNHKNSPSDCTIIRGSFLFEKLEIRVTNEGISCVAQTGEICNPLIPQLKSTPPTPFPSHEVSHHHTL